MECVAIIILAAGGSRRFGEPKQLVEWNGEPLLLSVARSACGANTDRVIVVLGAQAPACMAVLEKSLNIDVIINDAWDSGIASSIRVGIESAEKAGAKAILLVLADQPYLTTEVINRFLDQQRSQASVIAARYEEIVGPPILFGSEWFTQLKNLQGDEGARHLIRDRRDSIKVIDWPEGAIDFDTPEDLKEENRKTRLNHEHNVVRTTT